MAQKQDQNAAPPPIEPKRAVSIRSVLGVISAALLGLFLLQNLQEVDVHFLWMSFSTRLTWALLAAAAFGVIALAAFATLRRRDER
ncbi:MAG: DUF1049 domain-containing protein [Dehalococcoidia bacterium]|nr:MAG: DUF1049 domain-containing protein [Dehalococcoidia bacterium]